MMIPHSYEDNRQRFCAECARGVTLSSDQVVERVSLERLGLPAPALNEWPVAELQECEECGAECVILQAEKGHNVARYICAEEHVTAIIATKAGNGWDFTRAPF